MNGPLVSRPPMPFRGNKSKWIKYLFSFFKDNKLNLNKQTIIIDLFGGSGLLSILFKQLYPDNTVIFNDYDNYLGVLKEVDKIDDLRAKLYSYLSDTDHQEPFSGTKVNHVFDLIKHSGLNVENPKILGIISSWLMQISGRQLTFKYKTLYNHVPVNPYKPKVIEYLQHFKDIKVIHQDYKAVINYFKTLKNVFYILDPPYLQSTKDFYKDTNQWSANNLLEIIDLALKHKSILFESTRSKPIILKYIKQKHKPNLKINISHDKQFSTSEDSDYFILFNV